MRKREIISICRITAAWTQNRRDGLLEEDGSTVHIMSTKTFVMICGQQGDRTLTLPHFSRSSEGPCGLLSITAVLWSLRDSSQQECGEFS